MSLNISSFNNASTTSIWSAMEHLNYNDNEFFKQGVAALTTALQSRLSSLLFLIVSLIWTRIQLFFILVLTESKEQIICLWTQRNRGRGAQSRRRDGDTIQYEIKTWRDIPFIVIWFAGLVYVGRPSLSQFFIMLWGKLWVSDVNMAIAVIEISLTLLYFFVILTPFWSLLKCVMKLEEAKEKLPMAERDQYIRDNFYSHVKSEYLPTLKENICLCSSWALRTLQDLLKF
ncbi:hypothetical protein CFAM422_000431 [Trichoderma lentiforme]|uniref:Uncharacterized protein n=1 Tax=Trichoderma lentiforme TaxID=1567552 RepID=A0A9P4XRI0_9HYPO|nr:hypothetical protein CFAM422_000431 [Trichoderma lentiforme]